MGQQNFQNRAVTAMANEAGAVERILAGIGVDPVAARMTVQDGYGYSFRRGSATIEIYITQREGVGYVQALAPIMHLPTAGLLPLYRQLLELNLQLTDAALGVYLDVVYVFSERSLDGLDIAETDAMISLVAAYADELDDRLVGEFGGRLYGRI
jgi:hypothetical protein